MNKPKLLKIILTIAIAGGLAVPLSGCALKSDAETVAENQVAAVARGDITIDIASAGNLSFCREEELAFEMSGTVEEVLVEVGDSVEEGQVLATLDTSEWEDQLLAVELDLIQAQINLKNAEIALDKAINPYTDEEIEDAEQAVEDAEYELNRAESELRYALTHGSDHEVTQWQTEAYSAQRQLDLAEETLDDMLYERDEDDIEIKGMQLEIAQGRLENAKKAVDEALAAGPEITAPFDGFVTLVNVSGGDEILKGTVAVQIADPTRFETVLLVSEVDIFDITLGGEAYVQVDATTDVPELPAEVTYISPTAIIQSGVVNYEVTVEVESLETVRQQQQEAIQARQEEMEAAAAAAASGEIPEQLQEAITAGQITQEQAEAMLEQMQQMPQMPEATLEQMPGLIPEDFELKEGLSVTVSIIIEGASDVLLVPNEAITYRLGEAYVQVVSSDGTTEERLIETGISDWQYTEVTDGLSEGEQVLVPETTGIDTSTTPDQEFQGAPGGMMMPGMGGMGGPR
jgi:multidrug efflux pump subunit AcrA (membrane-fusion protein)